ncbi:MAG: FAD-binding protein, partial [Myxococcales bacterium]|nr:FAD-binding protein [Myxococcales bacterium]
MCSTFGGWLAARSAGQFSTKYGKIEDMVRRLTFVDGRGDIHTVDAGAAPDVAQWLVGSEGTLGIITRATVTVCPQPEARLYRGWTFPRVAAGCEAIRRLVQRNLRPACVRLYDELDSFLHRGEKDHDGGAPESSAPSEIIGQFLSLLTPEGTSVVGEWKKRAVALALARPELVNRLASTMLPYAQKGCLFVVGFEGERGLAEAEARAAAVELERAGGRDLGEGPGLRWLEHRYAVSFRMQKVFDAGAFVDTMEVATSWDKLLELYRAVREAVSPLAFIMA